MSNAQLSREHLQRSQHCPTSLTSLTRASVALVLWLPICDYTTLQQLPPLTGLRHPHSGGNLRLTRSKCSVLGCIASSPRPRQQLQAAAPPSQAEAPTVGKYGQTQIHKPSQFKYKYTIAHIHKPPSQRKPGLENVFYTHHACSSTWN